MVQIYLAWSPNLMQNQKMTNAVESLSEFIARKLRELALQEQSLQSQLAALRVERSRLQSAEAAAKLDRPLKTRVGGRKGPKDGVIKPNTIMAEVIDILGEHPGGMIALDILGELNKHRDPPLLRTSLSPQLSRLKKSGYVHLNGSNWTLLNRGKTEITATDLFSGENAASEKHEAADVDPTQETSAASSSFPEQDGKARLGGGP
jgi:hypothetical protein